jgi:acyl-CoA thioesterase I
VIRRIILCTLLTVISPIGFAQKAGTLPEAPLYKGEISRGADGRLMVRKSEKSVTLLNGVSENWIVIGSSTAAGVGASRASNSWAARLQAHMAGRSVAVVNMAKGGSTTFNGLTVMGMAKTDRPKPNSLSNVDAALANGPRLLIVAYPSNDTASGYSVQETVSNLLSIRATASAKGVAVIMLGTQPRFLNEELLSRLVEIDRRLDMTVSPCFVALREELAGTDGRLDARFDSGDGVHPNDAGHALIYERVRTLLDAGQCVRFTML